MIIEKIDIKSFGQLTNLSLDFSESINVIEGQNEAGKSTIAAFIKYMLYGFDANEPEGTVSERQKRINWDTGVAEGSMVVSVKGKKYHITRSTVTVNNGGRTTYKEDSSIIDMENGTPAFGKLPAGEVFFGVDKELFENTAFVGQLGDTAIKEGSVKDAIENIIFSGNERINTQRACNLIREKMETLLHQGNTGGAIYDLIRKQEELEEKLRTTDEANKQILAKEAELHEIRALKEEAESRRSRLYDLDQCYCNVMLIQSFDKLHELEEESDRKAESYNSYIQQNSKDGFVPSQDYLTDLALARKGVNDTYKHLTDAKELYTKEKSAIGITREIEGAIELSDEHGGEASIRDRISLYFANKIKCVAGGIFALLAFIAAVVFEIAGAALPLPLKIIVGILGALALGGTGALAYLYLSTDKKERALVKAFDTESVSELKDKINVIESARNKRDTMINSTENARCALEAAKDEYEAAKTHLNETVLKWSEEPPVAEVNDFLDRLEIRVKAFLEEKAELLDEKNNLEITVKEIRRTLSDKSEIDIRAQVSPLKRKVLCEINHDEIINGIAEAKAVIEEQQRLSFNVESELTSLKIKAIDPGELYSKIQALDTQIEDLRARHKAYYVALRAMESASDNLRAEISPRLSEYATELLGVMTNEKYASVAIDPSLKVNFTTRDGKNKSVDYLSGGTRDLTYIAVRMSLIDMLYSEKPPVCFDETFASQDNLRAESMMKAISKLCDDGYQSFVFTCRAREAALATAEKKNAGIYKLSVTGE